jgi:hypothetical protein
MVLSQQLLSTVREGEPRRSLTLGTRISSSESNHRASSMRPVQPHRARYLQDPRPGLGKIKKVTRETGYATNPELLTLRDHQCGSPPAIGIRHSILTRFALLCLPSTPDDSGLRPPFRIWISEHGKPCDLGLCKIRPHEVTRYCPPYCYKACVPSPTLGDSKFPFSKFPHIASRWRGLASPVLE